MRRTVALSASLLLVVSCGGGGGDPTGPAPAAVASVTLNQASASLVPQQTVQLTATPRDAAGNVLSGRTISWSSSAPAVATVDGGLVTAVAAGTATITATSEGRNATAAITVQDGGVATTTGVTITAAGGKVQIVVPAQAVSSAVGLTVAAIANPPASGSLIPGTAYDFGPSGTQFSQPVTLRITWDAAQVPGGADPSLFRLHLLTGGAWQPVAGSTVNVATRTVEGSVAHFSSYGIGRLPAPVASIELSPAGPLSLPVNGTVQLTATPKDAAGTPLTGRVVTWTTSNAPVATVSTSGLINGVAPGTATITAASEGVTAQVGVTVLASQNLVLTKLTVGYHSCGLTSAGAAWCWGQNANGELGDGTTTQRSRPVLVSGNLVFSQIAAGLNHTCGLTPAGAVWCWGGNAFGQLGDGTTAGKSVPTPVTGLPPVSAISAYSLHTCALTAPAPGLAYCWGYNLFGQLGDGTTIHRSTPVQVAGGHAFATISAGVDRTCGVIQFVQVWCWGSNGGTVNSSYPNDILGILGTGSLASPILQPEQVVGNIQWSEVTSGYRFSCGRTPAGQVRCWGANTFSSSRGGQIGDGSIVTRIQPVLIATGAETFTSVGAGFYSACALSTAGEAWCWGANYTGEVGDGGPADPEAGAEHRTPIKVVGGLRFTSLVAAMHNACGLTAAGETWCWGNNWYGQLGDGTTTHRSTPVRVVP